MTMLLSMTDYLVGLLTIGSVMRIVFCLSRLSGEDSGVYKKRLRNVAVFFVIMISVWGITRLVLDYFGIVYG